MKTKILQKIVVIWCVVCGSIFFQVYGYADDNSNDKCIPGVIRRQLGENNVVVVFNFFEHSLTELYISWFMFFIDIYKTWNYKPFTIGYNFYESCGNSNITNIYLEQLFNSSLCFTKKDLLNSCKNRSKIVSVFYFGTHFDVTSIKFKVHEHDVPFYHLSDYTPSFYNHTIENLNKVVLFEKVLRQFKWDQIALLNPFSSDIGKILWERIFRNRSCLTVFTYENNNLNLFEKVLYALSQTDNIKLTVIFGSDTRLDVFLLKNMSFSDKIFLSETEIKINTSTIKNENTPFVINFLNNNTNWIYAFIKKNLKYNFNITDVNMAMEHIKYFVPTVLKDSYQPQLNLQSFLDLYQNFSSETQNISFYYSKNFSLTHITSEVIFRADNSISCNCINKSYEYKRYFEINISQVQCEKCKNEMYFSVKMTPPQCVQFTRDFLLYKETLSYVAYCTMIFGALLTIFVGTTFVRYQNTPLVKSANLKILLIQLVAHSLLYIAPIMFFGEPTVIICAARPSVHGVLLIFAIAMVMTKTQKLVFIFHARIRVSRKEYKMSKTMETMLIFLMLSVQGMICVLTFKVRPAKVLTSANEITGLLTIKCGNDYDFSLQLLYGLVLIVMCLMQAFRARNLPGNFSEVRVIILAMLSVIFVTALFLPIRFTQNTNKGLLLVEVYYVLAGNTALFSVLHGYKCWVIIYRPTRNRASLFRQNITNHVLKGVNGNFLTLKSCESFNSNVSTRTTFHDEIELKTSSPQTSCCESI